MAKDVPAIIRICQLVAGMPLGVELAAAWVRIYSCEEIADKIEQNLRFLVNQRPDVPDRHQGLYAVCDYFWEQLSEGERAVLSANFQFLEVAFIVKLLGKLQGRQPFSFRL